MQKLLTAFVCGLNGRSLKIEAAEATCTDTESIFLPGMISAYASREDNFFYYKLLTVYQWAQNWFGSWRYDLSEQLNHYDDPPAALKLFHCLESIRLLYKIHHELPGFFRQAEPYLKEFRILEIDPQWQSICVRLCHKAAEVDESFDLLKQYYSRLSPVEFSFQGVLLPNKVQLVKERRLLQEKDLFREVLARMADEKKQAKPEFFQMEQSDPVFDLSITDDPELPDGMRFELALDGLNERVFTKMLRSERNIAVMFMVDMSGSTKGWINQAERESLVLLCESLEMLGDRYAIYGFSGTTRKRCEIYHIKHLDKDYSDKVKARISGITAKDYTRMGFAIRHLSALLEEVEARTKLLITLSDGKPEDYDGQYRGEYGIEDTRQSLFEARQKGIYPYCITIDKEAGSYLPHMYGAANYVLIEDINKLPLKVSDIYRKLTT